jgi:hypothetical protein
MISLFDGFISGLRKTDAELADNKDNKFFITRYHYRPVGLTSKEDRGTCDKILIEYEPYINQEDFIGWPISSRIGGFHVEEKALRYFGHPFPNYRKELLVSDKDVHPNKEGHEKIAEFLYDRLG